MKILFLKKLPCTNGIKQLNEEIIKNQAIITIYFNLGTDHVSKNLIRQSKEVEMKIAAINADMYKIINALISILIFPQQLGQCLFELNVKNEFPKENGEPALIPQYGHLKYVMSISYSYIISMPIFRISRISGRNMEKSRHLPLNIQQHGKMTCYTDITDQM